MKRWQAPVVLTLSAGWLALALLQAPQAAAPAARTATHPAAVRPRARHLPTALGVGGAPTSPDLRPFFP